MAAMVGRLLALALGLALSAGCSTEIAGGAADGPKIFAEACAVCHGPTGRPPESMAVSLGVRDLTAPEFRARVTVELVEKQIRNGSDNKKMPAFEERISAAQIRAVAEYVVGTLGH
jgi:mono/diheme cytochrome c family protein